MILLPPILALLLVVMGGAGYFLWQLRELKLFKSLRPYVASWDESIMQKTDEKTINELYYRVVKRQSELIKAILIPNIMNLKNVSLEVMLNVQSRILKEQKSHKTSNTQTSWLQPLQLVIDSNEKYIQYKAKLAGLDPTMPVEWLRELVD